MTRTGILRRGAFSPRCLYIYIIRIDMDLKKIFIKDACPTKVGGQAVMEGVMMKGAENTAVCVRLPDGGLYIKTEKNAKRGRIYDIPLIRGVFVFIASLVQGIKTLMFSADVLEEFGGEGTEDEEEDRLTRWMIRKFGEKKAWSIMMGFAVVIAIVFTVLIFIVAPTVVVNLAKHFTSSGILLNIIEGVLRIALFVGYVALIARMDEIKRVFQYHGAEHKTIHCYENGLELKPGNAKEFRTMNPRFGTSFLMFVMVVALALFSMLGWPGLLWRVLSRILLLPVIAGLSYELLRWAGRSDNIVIRILSVPGLLLQKLTTKEPDEEQLEVAICAMKAVLAEEGDIGSGRCGADGRITEHMDDTVKKGEGSGSADEDAEKG